MSSIALPLHSLGAPIHRSLSWSYNRAMPVLFIVVLCSSLVLGGCIFGSFANFVAVAEADLPTVLQMITNITNIVAPGVSPAIGVGGALAVTALQLVCGNPAPGATKCDASSLIGQYQANPSATLLGKIQAALATANSHITDILGLAKGLPQSVGAAIATGLGLALTTITSIISLIPTATKLMLNRKATLTANEKAILKTIPHPATLKARFNAVIGGQWPTAVVR